MCGIHLVQKMRHPPEKREKWEFGCHIDWAPLVKRMEEGRIADELLKKRYGETIGKRGVWNGNIGEGSNLPQIGCESRYYGWNRWPGIVVQVRLERGGSVFVAERIPV